MQRTNFRTSRKPIYLLAFLAFANRARRSTTTRGMTCTHHSSREHNTRCIISTPVENFLHRPVDNRRRASGNDQKRANRTALIRLNAWSADVSRRPKEVSHEQSMAMFLKILEPRRRAFDISAERVTARVFSSALRSRPADWPCRQMLSSPARRTSRSLAAWF